MAHHADIDIDFADRNQILDKIEHRTALLSSGKKHNTGVYVSEIPHNPITNVATINYKEADNRGYFKLDFLNVSIYETIKNEAHLEQLMHKEPMWELLEHDEFVNKVFHLSGHGEILRVMKPRSIPQLAAVLAIIRPAKRHLINKEWKEVFEEVWKPPVDNSYYFKKAHSFSYAFAVVVHVNLLCDEISS